MSELPAVPANLDDAIQDAIEQGKFDPDDILDYIEKRHGSGWLQGEVLMIAHGAVRERIRAHLVQTRRAAYTRAIGQPYDRSGHAILEHSKFVPDVGWKKIGDLTAEDCRRCAIHYKMLADRHALYADLFTRFAEMIEEESVGVLGEVKADLPLEMTVSRRQLEAI